MTDGSDAPRPVRETDLYRPIKTLLEGQGFVVKAEIGDADVVALRGDEPPVIVELKTNFSLALFHQAIERQKLTDAVYVATARREAKGFAAALKANRVLCRRLGLGLITVRLRDGFTEIHCDPAPFRPVVATRRKTRLLREFARRVGDPNEGGASKRGGGRGLMTAYRQDALRLAALLAETGPAKASAAAQAAGVPKARNVMADDHYGWFERVRTGVYALTPRGRAALIEYGDALEALRPSRAEGDD